MAITNNFGKKLKDFAIIRYGTLTNLANVLGMSVSQLSQYVNGKNKPGMEFFTKLLEAGCDINWLISKDDNPLPQTNPIIEARIKKLEEQNKLLRDNLKEILRLIEEIKKKKII